MQDEDIFSYIKSQETNYKTARVPLTGSKSWNMHEHIERCTNVANGWYHTGANDGVRPYDDLVTPIINVAFRSEGFDAKDIVPFVNDIDKDHLSFVVKKYAPQWNRKVELDTIIDDIVESSVIYDLVLTKNLNNQIPEVVDLKSIAFCDQTDVLAGPICIRHEYSVPELIEYKGKWDSEKIDLAIANAKEERKNSLANGQTTKTPSKNIEVYELRGNLPAKWLKEEAKEDEFVNQMQMVAFYTDTNGDKKGITLYKGKDKNISENFKALKIDRIRSKGRACGRSIVESLFEEQVWNNYSAIKIKNLLDSAVTLFLTDSDELGGKKLNDLKTNTMLKQARGDTTQKLDGSLQNMQHFENYSQNLQTKARIKGSASEAQLGTNPVSGTPFALQNLVVQQGQGIHEYRRGKVATFFADQLYRDWILQMMVDDLNKGMKFSEVLSLEELQEVSEAMAKNLLEKEKRRMVLNGELITPDIENQLKLSFVQQVREKHKNRGFFEIMKGELQNIPMSVFVNVAGKQRDMAQNADKITNILREVVKNPQAYKEIPGIAKIFNELLEESGFSPINFSEITKLTDTPAPTQTAPTPQPQLAPQGA